MSCLAEANEIGYANIGLYILYKGDLDSCTKLKGNAGVTDVYTDDGHLEWSFLLVGQSGSVPRYV